MVLGLTLEEELAVGNLDRELDALVDQGLEAFEVGNHLVQLVGFLGADITAVTALAEGITQLPIGAVFLSRALELLAEGTRAHGAELVKSVFGLLELFLPRINLFVLHTDIYRCPY